MIVSLIGSPGTMGGASAAGPVPALAAPGPCVPASDARVAPERVMLKPTASGLGFSGYMELSFARSPYGITVSRDGRNIYDIGIQVETVRRLETLPVLVAWATTPDLDRHLKLGVLGDDLALIGRVDWNKFLVLVTAEESAEVELWKGSVLLTAISPSGRMHTMAGHGIFEGNGMC